MSMVRTPLCIRPATPVHFVVAGAGVDSVNGQYEVCGYYNGALLFCLHNEEHGVTHYLFCTAPRLKLSKHSTWAICSSISFPDAQHDIMFYTSKSTFLDGVLPTHMGWTACARQSKGLALLMEPPPSMCGLVRSPACVDMLAFAIIDAEKAEDERVSTLVEAQAAEVESREWECGRWVDSGACSDRFRACRMRHSAASRGTGLQMKCAKFSSDEGCYKSSYECNGFHNWDARKMRWRRLLLRAVPTLVVEVRPPSPLSRPLSPLASKSPRARLLFA